MLYMVQTPKPRAYIATRLSNHEAHNRVRDALAAIGISLTYDWTVHGSVKCDGALKLREVSTAEAQGVIDAHVCVVLLPGGRGTHSELGIAIGARVPVLLVQQPGADFFNSDERTSLFYHYPRVNQKTSDDPAAIAADARELISFYWYNGKVL